MSKLLKAAVVIDKWKRPIFEKILKEDGFTFSRQPGITSDTLVLRVTCSSPMQLKPTIERAQLAAARSKMN